MVLAEKLTVMRIEKGLTQEQVAEKLGVSKITVAQWEGGQVVPDVKKLKDISLVYDISLDNLLDDTAPAVMQSIAKKRQRYKEVIYLDKPSSERLEEEYTKLLPIEQEHVKKRKKIIKICKMPKYAALVFALLFVVFVAISAFNPSLETTMFDMAMIDGYLLFIALILWGIARITRFFIEKYYYPDVEDAHTYFNEKVAKIERTLKEKGYFFRRLQPDLAQYFFYDTVKNVFGFYFNGAEQFICPIGNFVSYNYYVNEQKLDGFELFPIRVCIKYCDELGDINDYEFGFSMTRTYVTEMVQNDIKDREDLAIAMDFTQMHSKGIFNATKKVQDEIIERLQFEKAKYDNVF